MPTTYRQPFPERRIAGVMLTVLVHATLFMGWQMARRLPPAKADPDRPRIQWIWLPEPAPLPGAPARELAQLLPVHPRTLPAPMRSQPNPSSARAIPDPAPPATPAADTPAPTSRAADVPAQAPQPASSAEQILQRARRDIGGIDKALRKDSKPTIVAPPDSPEIRLRNGIGLAHDLAPPKLWEAPKVEELVNNTGDGARRTRVITGRRTYCVTERATNTNVEMIEMHGKLRITNCPTHEEPAKQQEWRTARD